MTYEALRHIMPDMERTKGLKPYEIGYSAIVSRKEAVDMIMGEFMNWDCSMSRISVRDLFNMASRAVLLQGQLSQIAEGGKEWDAKHPPAIPATPPPSHRPDPHTRKRL